MKRDFLNSWDFSKRFASADEQTISYRPYSDRSLSRETSFKVLSWNINKNNQDQQWIREFVSIVVAHQPNVICLQEVRWPIRATAPSRLSHHIIGLSTHIAQLPKAQSAIASQLDTMSWSFAPNFADTIEQTYSGVLTLSKKPLICSAALLTQNTEPITQTPKVSLVTEYAFSNESGTAAASSALTYESQSQDSFIVINTHLINFVESSVFQTQIDQISAAIKAHSGAVILAGDFNTWSRDRLRRLNAMTEQLSLFAATFNLQNIRKIKRFLLSPPLDHIFYRGFSYRASKSTVIDSITSSDHRPLVIELSR